MKQMKHESFILVSYVTVHETIQVREECNALEI